MSVNAKPSDDSSDILLKKIGNSVRELRKKREKNYEEFARKHKINKVTLQRLETGQNFTTVVLFKSGTKCTNGSGFPSVPISRCFFSSGIALRLTIPQIKYLGFCRL